MDNLARSHFKTRFRRENGQFSWLAMSENDGIFGKYVEFERSSQAEKGPFAAEIGVLKMASIHLNLRYSRIEAIIGPANA